MLSVMDHCLRSRHYVNVVIAGKHPAPQWLTMDAAVKHCTEGIGIWQWAPDVVMACCGDVPTPETLAAGHLLLLSWWRQYCRPPVAHPLATCLVHWPHRSPRLNS
jgi:phosphoketolase